MKYILLLSFALIVTSISAQTRDTTITQLQTQQVSFAQPPHRDTVYVVQQPSVQKIENEYSVSSGTQILYIAAIALSVILLLVAVRP